jgi:hypothetical protein
VELRLLLLGSKPQWLPPWKAGRILVGSSPTADAALPGALRPFHCVVELAAGAVLVHDLARGGDVADAEGRPVPAEGLLVRPGERFRVGSAVIGVVAETVPATTHQSGLACLLCDAREPGGRSVAGAYLCPGCHGVLDIEPDTCPGYELVARLGSGGMGTVYLAHHAVLDRLVAIKLLNRGSAGQGPHALARFLREIRVLSHLDHPSIVKVLDARSVRGLVYLVSELVPSGDALGLLRRNGPLGAKALAALGVQLASALAYAHEKGVIHRDVKPANVLIDGAIAKLTDFGLAKDRTVTASTGSNALLGTMAYAAPEQLRDARKAGPPADVHGLAASLYHLATGRAPRDGTNVVRLSELVDIPPPSAHTINPTLARDMSLLIDLGLRPDPRERPSMSMFGTKLAQLR